jgi:hypothetical protein
MIATVQFAADKLLQMNYWERPCRKVAVLAQLAADTFFKSVA